MSIKSSGDDNSVFFQQQEAWVHAQRMKQGPDTTKVDEAKLKELVNLVKHGDIKGAKQAEKSLGNGKNQLIQDAPDSDKDDGINADGSSNDRPSGKPVQANGKPGAKSEHKEFLSAFPDE